MINSRERYFAAGTKKLIIWKIFTRCGHFSDINYYYKLIANQDVSKTGTR